MSLCIVISTVRACCITKKGIIVEINFAKTHHRLIYFPGKKQNNEGCYSRGLD